MKKRIKKAIIIIVSIFNLESISEIIVITHTVAIIQIMNVSQFPFSILKVFPILPRLQQCCLYSEGWRWLLQSLIQ